MKFRIVRGGHTSGHGDSLRFYDEGSVIDSPLDLARIYPEKFEPASGVSDAEPQKATPQKTGK